MTDQQICLECGEPFSVRRHFKNRHAAIRFCDDCKDSFADVRQAERTTACILKMCGTRRYLAMN